MTVVLERSVVKFVEEENLLPLPIEGEDGPVGEYVAYGERHVNDSVECTRIESSKRPRLVHPKLSG